MAVRFTTIGGKTYWSSDTAGSGMWGTAGGVKDPAGFQWFPSGGGTAAAAAPAPAAAAAPSIDPVLDNNVSVSVYGRVIPISAGKRRLPGDLIWLKDDQLNTEGDYTANAAYSFGYRLIPVAASLVKVWANGVKIYDAEAGFTAEGFSFVWYDGSQEDVDLEIAADKGADITPAFKHQLYIRGIFPTKEFNGSLPNISALVEDEPNGFEQFLPWAGAATSETLNPADCSTDITLSDGNLTAERTSGDAAWRAVRSTKGRASDQSLGSGWFVFEARTDVISTPAIIFPTEYQGPGLASETYNVETGDADGPSALYASVLGDTLYNGLSTGAVGLANMPIGAWVMFAVRLDVMRFWKSTDGGFGWILGADPAYDPIANTGGLDISYLSGQGLIYPAWFSGYADAKGSFNFSGSFANTPPGWEDTGGLTAVATLEDVITAVALRCGFAANDLRFVGLGNIKVTGVVIASDTDFLSFLKNASRIFGFDYVESGGQILCRKAVIGTSYTVDVGDIPEAALIPTSNEAAVTTTRDNSHRPEIIELSYQDETIDYQPSVQRARIPRIKSPMTDKFGVPFVMSSQEAITGAATALYREHFARVSHAFQLPFQYQRIEPTDLIEFTSSGKAYTVKVSNVVRNSDLSVRVTAVNLLTAEAEPITDTFSGENYEDYRGGGYSGDPNIDNIPLAVISNQLDFSERGSSGYVALLEDI